MSTSVTLPALGESVTEGTVSRWLKQVGDTVEADEPLLEVSTDKVDTEIPSPASGVLLEIKAQEDETVEVGAVLAVIGEPSEADGGAAPDEGAAAEAPAAEEPTAEEPTAEAPEEPTPQESGAEAREEPAPEEPAAEAPAEQAAEQAAPQQAEDSTPETEEAPQTEAPDEPAETEEPEPESGSAAASEGRDGTGGATQVTLPELGESVTEGTVSRWLKRVGESVNADEPLLEVSTDKVDTEIPSPASGTLLEIRVQEDETVGVGAVLAVIGSAGAAATPPREATPQPAPEAEPQPPPQQEPEPEPEPEPQAEREPEPQPQAEPEPEPQPQAESRAAEPTAGADGESEARAPAASTAPTPAASESDRTYVTPLVRKLAKEHDVDLESLNGTGVGGRIRKQDVLAAAEAAKQAAAAPAPEAPAEAPAPAPAAEVSSLRGTTEKMSRLRQTIARRMVESLQVAAQLTATVEVDMTAISRIRSKVKEDFKNREGATLSYLPFIAKALVEALKVYPKVNATIDTEERTITYPDAEHLGIAVQTDRGLLVPVIKDAGDLSIAGLAKRIADLAARTRQNKVTPDELIGGTFTITNYGSAGTLMDTPIINQPQVAILGTGALVKRPVVLSDERLGEVIAIRDMMYLSLSYDHRLIDGAEAAQFLSTLKARLEEGDFGAEFGL